MTSRTPAPPSRPGSTPGTSSTPPDHVGLLLAAVTMMLTGWGSLYVLVTTRLPRIGGELWLFFILLLMAVTGTAIPVIRYLNVRFTPLEMEVPPGGVIVRQSVWVGLFVVTCAWMQIPRVLSLPLMLFLAVVLLVIEIFLRSRELAAERENL
ncbi:MAG: hypothetical protein MUE40_12785 [Anaerolineae bacterium]|nr:hypothetical protein [Anaerolineae bacterium]